MCRHDPFADALPSTWQQAKVWSIKRNSFSWIAQDIPYASAPCLLAGRAQEQSAGGRHPAGRRRGYATDHLVEESSNQPKGGKKP